MLASHRVYVGTIGEGLFRSLDGARPLRAWTAYSSNATSGAGGASGGRPPALYRHRARPVSQSGRDRLLAGRRRTARGPQIWSLLVPPDEPDALIAGCCPARVSGRSTPGRPGLRAKRKWKKVVRALSTRGSPAWRPTRWKRKPFGPAWRSADCIAAGIRPDLVPAAAAGITSTDLHDLAFLVGPEGLPRLFAATNRDLNVSDDGGDLHGGRHRPEPALGVLPGLKQPVGRPGDLLLGAGNGPPGSAGLVGRSTDGGRTWQPAAFPGQANSTMWNFATHAGDPDLVYASSVSGELYRSNDAGLRREKLPREFGEIRALAWTP